MSNYTEDILDQRIKAEHREQRFGSNFVLLWIVEDFKRDHGYGLRDRKEAV